MNIKEMIQKWLGLYDYAETQRNRFRVLESKLYDEIGKLKTELKKLKKDVKDFLNYKREIESEKQMTLDEMAEFIKSATCTTTCSKYTQCFKYLTTVQINKQNDDLCTVGIKQWLQQEVEE